MIGRKVQTRLTLCGDVVDITITISYCRICNLGTSIGPAGKNLEKHKFHIVCLLNIANGTVLRAFIQPEIPLSS